MYAALRDNFASGFRATTDQMDFWILPSTGIISEEPISPGLFERGQTDPSGFGYDVYPVYVMDFFHKNRITIRPLCPALPTIKMPGSNP
jgi:hypothetical protein